MASSRDSSVWKSLAGAFGDGLAFGVGMKLTQAARRPETDPLPELAPVEDRLGQIEQRVLRVEQAPPAPLDRKVLEAVVGAVEVRLKEQAEQVERRLAGMESKSALDLKSGLEEHQQALSAALSRMDEVRTSCREQTGAVRGEIGAVRDQVAAVCAEMEQTESRVSALVEERLNPLRAQLAVANEEIAELRRMLAESDSACRAMLMALGAAFRESTEQIARPAVEAPSPEPTTPAPRESAAARN